MSVDPLLLISVSRGWPRQPRPLVPLGRVPAMDDGVSWPFPPDLRARGFSVVRRYVPPSGVAAPRAQSLERLPTLAGPPLKVTPERHDAQLQTRRAHVPPDPHLAPRARPLSRVPANLAPAAPRRGAQRQQPGAPQKSRIDAAPRLRQASGS